MSTTITAGASSAAGLAATACYAVGVTIDPSWWPAQGPFIVPAPMPDPVDIPGARLLPDGCVAIPEERLRALLNEVADLKAKLAKVQEAAR